MYAKEITENVPVVALRVHLKGGENAVGIGTDEEGVEVEKDPLAERGPEDLEAEKERKGFRPLSFSFKLFYLNTLQTTP